MCVFLLFCCEHVCTRGWWIDVGHGWSDIKLKLANSTESELRALQSGLQAQKDDVAVDLQRNVFKKCVDTSLHPAVAFILTRLDSYAEFMLVSKEVSTLENEMLEFKEALSEWKGMPSLLHIDDSASVAGTSRPSLDSLREFSSSQSAAGTSAPQSPTCGCSMRTRCKRYTCR